jgi:hypothetical protein
MSHHNHIQLEEMQPTEEQVRQRIEDEYNQFHATKADHDHQAEHMKLEDSLAAPYWMPTKSNAMAAAQKVKQQVDEGFLNPLELNIRTKNLMDFCKQAIALTEDAAMVEAAKYSKGETFLEATIQVKKGADNFKYDHDEEWKKLHAALKQREEDMKAAYFAQQTGKKYVDADGVLVTPAVNNPNKNSLTIKHAA